MKKMMGLWEGSAPPRLGRRKSQKKKNEEEGGGRRESGIYSKGEGRVWLSEIKGLYDNL